MSVDFSLLPARVSYPELLEHFWVSIDPFDAGGQFCDRGHGYLSGLLVADAQQHRHAEASKQAVIERFPGKTVVTPILDTTTF